MCLLYVSWCLWLFWPEYRLSHFPLVSHVSYGFFWECKQFESRLWDCSWFYWTMDMCGCIRVLATSFSILHRQRQQQQQILNKQQALALHWSRECKPFKAYTLHAQHKRWNECQNVIHLIVSSGGIYCCVCVWNHVHSICIGTCIEEVYAAI